MYVFWQLVSIGIGSQQVILMASMLMQPLQWWCTTTPATCTASVLGAPPTSMQTAASGLTGCIGRTTQGLYVLSLACTQMLHGVLDTAMCGSGYQNSVSARLATAFCNDAKIVFHLGGC
jgi:hypothetical protein